MSYFLTGKICSHDITIATQNNILFPRRIVKAIKKGSDSISESSAKTMQNRWKYKLSVEKINMENVVTAVCYGKLLQFLK